MNIFEDIEFLNHYQGDPLEGIVQLLVFHLDEVSEFSPVPIGPPLVMSALSAITQNDSKWRSAIQYVIIKVPTFATFVINEIITEIPCPTAATVSAVFARQYRDSALGLYNIFSFRKEDINICAVLGCLAYKMAGVFSAEIFTEDVWNYLIRFLVQRGRSRPILMALIAIEKFAVTWENKIKIDAAFQQFSRNPLITLTEFLSSEYYTRYQVGFCARWALDNTFTVPGRDATYLSVDMSAINVILRQGTGYFMKISPDGLEVRCDSNSHGTVCATGRGILEAWYFEAGLVSSGPMRIGFATSKADMSEDFVVGNGSNSIGYDGSTRSLWVNSEKQILAHSPHWKAGDVVGFFINIPEKAIYLLLEDITIMTVSPEFFEDLDCENPTAYFPAATLAPYEHCRFNFGATPFVHTPPEPNFSTFNDVCRLTEEEKKVKPKMMFQSENSNFNDSSDACILCYNNTADTKLLPCSHSCFCRSCALKVDTCPVCCADIDDRV